MAYHHCIHTQHGEVANRILSVGSMDRALLIADNLQGPEGQKFQHLSGRGFLTITGLCANIDQHTVLKPGECSLQPILDASKMGKAALSAVCKGTYICMCAACAAHTELTPNLGLVRSALLALDKDK